MSRPLPRFDRQVYKYAPDQMVVRLNAIVDKINSENASVIVEDPKSNVVIIIGVQPDGTFGAKKWTKTGDNYTFISGVL